MFVGSLLAFAFLSLSFSLPGRGRGGGVGASPVPLHTSLEQYGINLQKGYNAMLDYSSIPSLRNWGTVKRYRLYEAKKLSKAVFNGALIKKFILTVSLIPTVSETGS